MVLMVTLLYTILWMLYHDVTQHACASYGCELNIMLCSSRECLICAIPIFLMSENHNRP